MDGVVADEQRGVEGLRQQRVDGDHHQQHGQFQHRVQPQEHGTGHHGQDAGEDKILPDRRTDRPELRSAGTKLNNSIVWLMDRLVLVIIWCKEIRQIHKNITRTTAAKERRERRGAAAESGLGRYLRVEADVGDGGRLVECLVPEGVGLVEVAPKL